MDGTLPEKLSLKKQTISNLSSQDLNSVKGGNEDSGSGCTICYDCYVLSIGTICIDTSQVRYCGPA
ncbi:MAG: class I lanthipeptide [Candidatus Aminicenantes bacterium]|nr:class I lanthipeptide [Candidatus Aminicenantes bacterium]